MEYNIAMALRAAYLSMHRMTNTHIQSLGVTADQFVCLDILSKNDGITQKELSDLATSDPNTISAMLLLLQRRGYIRKKKHPENKRAFRVSLTAEGKRILKKIQRELKPVREKMILEFNQQETADLFQYLSRISHELQS